MGIDYGNGTVNIDKVTNIRYGVISQHEVLQAWADSSEPVYPEGPGRYEWNTHRFYGVITAPNGDTCCVQGDDFTNLDDQIEACEDDDAIQRLLSDYEHVCEPDDHAEPLSHEYTGDGYEAQCGDSGDIFITKSPYCTLAPFCSPCALLAVYLMSAGPDGDAMGYCFGHDWFEGGKAPYKVYRVSDMVEVLPDGTEVVPGNGY